MMLPEQAIPARGNHAHSRSSNAPVSAANRVCHCGSTEQRILRGDAHEPVGNSLSGCGHGNASPVWARNPPEHRS